jgi:sortase (surface protein transpeptidase)
MPTASPRTVTIVAILLALAGGGALIVAVVQRYSPPPTPPASAAGRIDSATTSTAPSVATLAPAKSAPTTLAPELDFSAPTELTIPALGVDSELVRLDRNRDGTVQVPDSFHVAGWYQHSVSPGQIGPSVFLGHVDSKSGPGIFYRLGLLKPGDKIEVRRSDDKVATYVITGVRQYPKTGFPTIDVYGNTPTPTIRLITCGGAFDSATGHYVSNIVAFGQLA